MRPVFLFACALALLGCASTEPAPEAAPAALGVDLLCSADELVQRAAGGAEQRMSLPISLSMPGRGVDGRFCMATGCEAARIEPTLTRALGWTARVIANDRSSMNAELEISRDRSSFRLRRAESEGGGEWSGACNAAGS